MNADQLIADAAASRPPTPSPSLDAVERGLRHLLEAILAAFDYDAEFGSGAAQACRVHAMLIAEVPALRRMRGTEHGREYCSRKDSSRSPSLGLKSGYRTPFGGSTVFVTL